MGIICTDTDAEMKKQLDTFIQLAPAYLRHRGDAQAADALASITDLDRRMAAFWNYARYPKNKHRTIAEGWAWSEEKIKAYKTSQEKKTADAAIATVANLFRNDPAMAAKKYTLAGDTDPRSFEFQRKSWLRKDAMSVVNYGKGIRDNLVKEMARCELSPLLGPADTAGLIKFGKMIENYASTSSMKDASGNSFGSPLFAVPGLSDHGRSSAIDFIVHRPGKKDLGPNSGQRNEWRADGCAAALARAIAALNGTNKRKVFDGPLTNPDEPWHWTYNPPAEPQAKAA